MAVSKLSLPAKENAVQQKVNEIIDDKQDTLVSGTNIKTINNTSLLGSGNIDIQGGGTITVDDTLSTTSTNPVQNKIITNALDEKQNAISDLDKYLKNSAVSSSGLSILGGSVNKINVIAIGKYAAYDSSQVGANSFNLGGYSLAGEGSVSLGNGVVTKQYSIGILGGTSEPYAIQIGRGTNSTSYTMSVGLGQRDGNNNYINYQLLNSSGKIPDDRLNSTIAKVSYVDTKLLTKQDTITSSNKLSASLVSGLASVATSGNYNDLSNQPTIPDTSNLANKDLSNLSNTGNAKFQEPLVSGTNIKTINNNSILGSGNLVLDSLPSQTGKAGKFLQTDGTDASWEGVPGRNIGEIVSSTIPLTDAGLHLLDGALIQGSGIYSAFVDYIAGLVSTYPNLFVTESAWQTAVTTYGVCGKFVYDSVNDTVRLPKYSNKIYTSGINSTASVKGNGMTLGLSTGSIDIGLATDGSGYLRSDSTGNYGVPYGSSASFGTRPSNLSLGVTTDSTKSGIIADLANITTSLDGYYYIVIATSTKTDIQVDIDEIATDLNGKADVDLTNINASQSAKDSIRSWGMPDYTAQIIVSGAYSSSASAYTAPCDGILYYYAWCSSETNSKIYVNNIEITKIHGSGNGYGSTSPITIFLNKNDTFYITNLLDMHSAGLGGSFIPMKGVN